MSHVIPIEQAAAKLAELVDSLQPGDEIMLMSGDKAVAKIVPNKPAPGQRHAGNCKGMLVIHSDDNNHLKDFQDYMP